MVLLAWSVRIFCTCLFSILVISGNIDLYIYYLYNLFVLAEILIVRELLAYVKCKPLHGAPDGDHHSHSERLEYKYYVHLHYNS